MDKYHIKLTDAEIATLAKIDLRLRHASHDEAYKAHESNKEPILTLLKSLSDRDAIPPERRKYWTEESYQLGRLQASHKGVFERNGCHGLDIYTHPHFIPYLRYFLYGADLPEEVISAFENKVGNPQWVSSSDIVPIGKFARSLVRIHKLDTTHAPEEFFKLCLDMGLGLSTAAHIMRSAKKSR